MRMNERRKKALSALLCLCMLAQNAPAVAFAAQEDCIHHVEHTQECGYAAAVEGQSCTHSHDAAVCGYAEAVEEVLCACGETDENGALVHTQGCGYTAPVSGSDCTHVCDSAVCGYVEAVEGQACAYRCEICLGNDDEEEQETTAPSEPETTEATEATEAAEPIELQETVTRTIELDAAEFDNDEAFAAYVERLFCGDSGVSTFGPLAGDRLTDADKALYDYLKAQVADVADGTQTSVVFVLDPEEIGIPDVWSEKELGVPLLEGEGENLRITEAGQNAIVNKFFQQMNFQVVLNALLSDCPYNMYWFNKNQETFFNCSLGAGRENGEVVGYVTDFIVTMHVSKDYQGENDTTVDSEKPKSAAEAAATAKSVADAQAGKTDYEKLVAYKDYICDAVSYNYDAVKPDYERGYGDPYQMIYVFDGDPTTNVVCEGYSKALQYLCDLSGPDCISVMGLFGDAEENETHMWNIVTLNGKNYLADVTNSEEGTVGQCGELFLVGNASGSVEGGYLFTADGRELGYIYNSATRSLWDADKLTLAKEDYIVKPANLTATYGDTLADVTLPEGFVWQDEATTPVGNAGTNAFKATCTRGDAEHPEVLRDVLVIVTVKKAAAQAKQIPIQKHFHTYETPNSINLTDYLPEDRGTTTYAFETVTGDIFTADITVTDGTLSYTTKVTDAVSSGSIVVKAIMENYTDLTLSVPIQLVALAADTQKQTVTNTLTQVPAGLANMPELDTADEIKAKQTQVLNQLLGHDLLGNVAHYDVKLQFSPDNGRTWVNATPENFPKDGLTVTLPYPEGTGKDTHHFVVSHMFTAGSDAGKTETPTVEKTAEGIQFPVKSLSPVSVAWSAILYDVKIADVTNGTVYVSPAHASAGTQVSVTVTPDSGYRLSTLTVKDAAGNHCVLGATNDNAYIFHMPAADVTVTAAFVRKSTAAADTTNPKTGDDYHIAFWGGMMVTAMLGMALLLDNRKKFFGK